MSITKDMSKTLMSQMSEMQASVSAQLSDQTKNIKELNAHAAQTTTFMNDTQERVAALEEGVVAHRTIENEAATHPRRALMYGTTPARKPYVPCMPPAEEPIKLLLTPRSSSRRRARPPPQAPDGDLVGLSGYIPATAEEIKRSMTVDDDHNMEEMIQAKRLQESGQGPVYSAAVKELLSGRPKMCLVHGANGGRSFRHAAGSVGIRPGGARRSHLRRQVSILHPPSPGCRSAPTVLRGGLRREASSDERAATRNIDADRALLAHRTVSSPWGSVHSEQMGESQGVRRRGYNHPGARVKRGDPREAGAQRHREVRSQSVKPRPSGHGGGTAEVMSQFSMHLEPSQRVNKTSSTWCGARRAS